MMSHIRCALFAGIASLALAMLLMGAALAQPELPVPVPPPKVPAPHPKPKPLVLPKTPEGVVQALIKALQDGDRRMLRALVTERSKREFEPWGLFLDFAGDMKADGEFGGLERRFIMGMVSLLLFSRGEPELKGILKQPEGKVIIDAAMQLKHSFVIVKENGQWQIDLVDTLGTTPEKLPNTPEEILQVFLDACKQGRIDTIEALLTERSKERKAPDISPWELLAQGFQEMGIGGFQKTLLIETLSFMLLCHSEHEMKPAVQVAQGKIAINASTQLKQTFVLVKEDGQWKIDLWETLGITPEELEKMRGEAIKRSCQSNLKQLALGFLMCVQDYDEKFPDADKWCDQLYPYCKNWQIFSCPGDPDHKFGYAMNTNLSGVRIGDIENPAETVLLFESSKGAKNAADAGQSFPRPGRHLGGNCVAFVDGHVKWFKDEDLAKLRFEIKKAP